MIVKLAGETLKNTLSEHITATRAVLIVVPTIGVVTLALPVFGTPWAATWSKLLPPSSDTSTSTLLQLTGARWVLATSQLTAPGAPPYQMSLPDGVLTLNGPALVVTLIL